MKRTLFLLTSYALACLSPKANADQITLRVAAAADLKFAMEEIAKAYSAAHPGQKIDAIAGASGSFVTQIQQGAPFDVFLSADSGFPDVLQKAGKVDGTVFPYAIGHIVLWVPNDSKLDLKKGPEILISNDVRKIAIADPAHAPYGRAAEEALKKFGIYEKLSNKIVMGENIAQTAQFIETKAADIGIVALSLALSPTLKKEGRYSEIDPRLYTQMVQSGAVLKSSRHLKEAKEFRGFVLSAKGRRILHGFGFGPLK